MSALHSLVLKAWMLAACIMAVATSYAQKPDWIRTTALEGEQFGETTGKSILVHPDGNIYVLGQARGKVIFNNLTVNFPEDAIDDGFLAKYAPNGDLIWIKQLFQTYSTTILNRVVDFKVDPLGNLVFVGTCYSLTSIAGSTQGNGPFIAKIDKDANLIWVRFEPTFSYAEMDVSRRGGRIGFDPDQNILWFADLIDGFLLTGGLAVIKYSPEGAKLSTRMVTRNPTFYHPFMQDFSVCPDGSYVVSASFEISVAITNGPSLVNMGSNFNPGQFFIAKFSPTGSLTWLVYSSLEGSNTVTSHTSDQDGNVYASISTTPGSIINSYPSGVTRNMSGFQRSLMKINTSGKVDWINPTGFSSIEHISLAPDNLFYVTGLAFGDEFRYQSYFKSKTSTAPAGFIMKIDSDGNFHGMYMGQGIDKPETEIGTTVWGFQSAVAGNGNIYTMGNFADRMVWGCVPADGPHFAFYLVKHIPVDNPIRAITGPGEVCPGTEMTFSTDLVSNGVQYRWFTPEGSDPEPGAVLKNSITFTAKSEHHKRPVLVSITDLCDEYFAEPYVLLIPPPPSTPQFLTSQPLVCPGTSATFKINASTDNDYQWTLPSGVTAPDFSDSGGSLAFDASFVSGVIKVIASNLCGYAENTFNVGIYADPPTPPLTGNITLCPGTKDIITGTDPVNNALSYQWELPPFITFKSSYPQNQITLRAEVAQEFVSGEIKVRAVGQCKTSAPSTPITISRYPDLGIAEPITGAEDLCITGTKTRYSIPSISNSVQYTWTVPTGFAEQGLRITTEPYIDIEPSSTGSGTLSVHGSNNCNINTNTTSLYLTIYPILPKPKLQVAECDVSITVQDAEDFSWYHNDVARPDFFGNTIVLNDSGRYYVQVSNFCGTQTSEPVNAFPLLSSGVLIPNVITPNGDGKNDLFRIDRSIQESSITITNRWGQTIFTSPRYQNNWGSEVESGTYYLTLLNKCIPEGYRGWISVLK